MEVLLSPITDKLLELGLLGLSLIVNGFLFYDNRKIQNQRVEDALTRDDKTSNRLDKISIALEELLRR